MASTPITVRNASDTYVNQNQPSDTYADATRLAVRGGTDKMYAYIYFSRPFPLGVTITSATLRLYMVNPATGTRTVTLKKITESWKRNRINWNNAPAVTATASVAVSKTGGSADQEWAFDVQTHMQSVADGGAWYGWRLEIDEATKRLFRSAQAAQFKPYLEVTYSEAPDRPVDLRPGGGNYVGIPKPVLRCDFIDPAGNTDMAAMQVQINSTDVWTDPSFDTSTYATSVPELDLNTFSLARSSSVTKTSGSVNFTSTGLSQADVGSTIVGTGIPAGATIATVTSSTAGTLSAAATTTSTVTATITRTFAAMTAGTSKYWRVRVQDGAGLWSKWSDAELFGYQTKGTLTINSPASTTVGEPTPPVLWTFSGRTQSQWQVLVRDDEGTVLANSGRNTGTETSWTVPTKVIKRTDKTYEIQVRIWDTFSRETTPGDTAYVMASRSVTWTDDGTVSPVTNFTLTDLSPEPGVQITWQRSTAGDSWVILRNGDVIKDNLDPADTLVSGTTYKYIDRKALPNKANTYIVKAEVNGKTSTSNPTGTITPKPIGIWLMDEDRSIEVQLLGDDEGDWSMGEEAENYMPLGGNYPVRVTQQLRGYEGSISGLLTTSHLSTKTVAEMEADMLDLKRTPGQTYVLVLSDLAIPVVIGNVTVAPAPNREIYKTVSFDFWQVDDLTFKPRL